MYTHHSEIALAQFLDHPQPVPGYFVQRRLAALVLFVFRQFHARELARREMLLHPFLGLESGKKNNEFTFSSVVVANVTGGQRGGAITTIQLQLRG